MREKKEEKVNYGPPGWLVTNFTVHLSQERALKLQALRERLCEAAGENHIHHPEVALNALAERAFDLLLEQVDTHERSTTPV